MTRGGVEYNLKKTPYTYTINGFILHFSSSYYKCKFIDSIKTFTTNIKLDFEKRYNLFINNIDEIAIIKLYHRVEKRGFYIIDNKRNAVYESIEDFKFDCFMSNNVKEVAENG